MRNFVHSIKTLGVLLGHLWRNRTILSNPVAAAHLFMDSTPEAQSGWLRYGSMRFLARKEDLYAVTEVLVGGGYDFMLPYLKSLPHPPVVLDCGANIGSFGLRILRERPDAKIVSVEAAPDTFAILKINQEANVGNWHPVYAALWKEEGMLTLNRRGFSFMHTVQEAELGVAESIPARTLQSVRDEFGLDRVDILKVDIEGAEASVVPASFEALDAGVLIVEVHKDLCDPEPCCRILASRYQYAYVERARMADKAFSNIVYYLANEAVLAPGMVAVDLLDHLNTVYDPSMWGRRDANAPSGV